MKGALQFGLILFAVCASAAADSGPVDRVLILKRERRLFLLQQDTVVKSFAIAIGRGGLEPKRQEGDHRTPEGKYVIDRRNPKSRFHRALHISYPNDADHSAARRRGVSPGGDIMIHGITNGLGWVGSLHRLMDWTDGCIAVTDAEIDEIWTLVPDGTPVEIRP